MTAYKISKDSSQGVVIADGDTLTLAAGISIIDPSVQLTSRQGLDVWSGIQDTDGGNNHVSISGTTEGFTGVWLTEGSNTVTIGAGGSAYGSNAGVEFHDGGHDLLTIRAGGEVSSEDYAVWFGAFPHVDYTSLPDSGTDTLHNQGLIEGVRREAVRMVLGGNQIVNTGTIQADLEDAIDIQSGTGDPRNTISNSGTITGGPLGVAVSSGDAPMILANTGSITGDIDFGASADRFGGSGSVSGIVYGGGGNDRLSGGSAATSLSGGAGADYLQSGTGPTTFVYAAPGESTGGVAIDTIDGFDFSKDQILIVGKTFTEFDRIYTPHALRPGHAALIQAANGTWYMMIDVNFAQGYQAGADYDIKLSRPVNLDVGANFVVAQDSSTELVLADGDSVAVQRGVNIINPAVDAASISGMDNVGGIHDPAGGDNRITVYGKVEGFVGAGFEMGYNAITVGSHGYVYGSNCGIEFRDGGNNTVTVDAHGGVASIEYGIWFGNFPHSDYRALPESGADTVDNAGLIEGKQNEAIRMVLGGNVIDNSGIIRDEFSNEAILIQSAATDAHNTIVNSGTIAGGPQGTAIISGDAAMVLTNTGAIVGDIQFGASADIYSGSGSVMGTVFGGGGDDRLIGGASDMRFDGCAGADYLQAGTGVNSFVYNAASESTGGVAIDTLDGFDFARDHIVVGGAAIAQFDHLARPGLLHAGEAGLIQAANGDWYLMIDANGIAGYQAGADYDIKLTHPADMGNATVIPG
jgi:Ca2+-binding RTX toxin-like protein